MAWSPRHGRGPSPAARSRSMQAFRFIVSSAFACVALGLMAAACEPAAEVSATDQPISPDEPPSPAPTASTRPSKDEPPPLVTTKHGIPCDVDAVLKAKCQTCHGAEKKYGAPNVLVTHDDLTKDGMLERVQARINDAERPMPPVPTKLTDAEKKLLNAWVDGGGRPSDATCTNPAPTDGVKALNCTPDTILKAKIPFEMKAGSALDQYVCFGTDISVAQKRHVTALAPLTDNKKILHHILLFQSPKSESPDPKPCSANGSASWKLVAGWAPGGTNLELPPEAGYPEEKGTTHWVVQLHYNNANNAQGEKDASGYQLCTTDKLRTHDAGVLAFGSTKFSLPPRANTVVQCDYRLGAEFKNVKVFNASPHMHTRGASMISEKLAGGKGAPATIHDTPAFDFGNQANYPADSTLTQGDVVRTRCGFKNMSDQTIGFGEATDEEMCFNFLSYYPAIADKTIGNLPVFTWITPSMRAICANLK
jgi:hypothetical protein